MSTFTNNDNNPQRPLSAAGGTAPGGVHRGIWIAGGLMAVTIVALATTLVVRSNDSSADAGATAQMVAPVTTASNVQAPVAQAPVAQAPVVEPQVVVAQQKSAPVVHRAAPRTYGNGGYAADSSVAGGGPSVAYHERQAAAVCNTCGVVESYNEVRVEGQANGVGAVAGGLGGALLGNKIAGRNNHTLGGVVGAIGGGLLGNAIEKRQRTVTEYDVRVRMNDGSYRTFREHDVPSVGSHVTVQGNTLHTAQGQG
jgi:outer membrane lipoprotein SlyB